MSIISKSPMRTGGFLFSGNSYTEYGIRFFYRINKILNFSVFFLAKHNFADKLLWKHEAARRENSAW